MSKNKKQNISVLGTPISVVKKQEKDFLSLTDMVKNFEGGNALIEQWLRNKNTIEFLGVWEKVYNPNFNSLEFEGIKNEAGTNRFYLSAKKWISTTGAIGLVSKAGRYGGTFAHKDIAFEFGSWLSPEFKLYLIVEFQKLKELEHQQKSLAWDVKRLLSKINYRLHTDAIKEYLIPPKIEGTRQVPMIYANEADLLNMAIFGMTAKQWKQENPDLKGNIRDHATPEQLLILANIENLNAEFIKSGLDHQERLEELNRIAIYQMGILIGSSSFKKLKEKHNKQLPPEA
ncbi:KilA-N domain-containing protein [Aureispira anguillae]|uniref:KilA-N domain-containing protein n=1 Tax=Aureispira anguillae TaxID=2864201 RepID=A0A915YMG2_9BACT|nr:KilA-N domain-containing protein [Aureispira anguillae]BDS15652.1 KilA-N domain-containing protein [Aureispira anguillae]